MSFFLFDLETKRARERKTHDDILVVLGFGNE